ncbi:protein phosphatase 2C 70-like [Impatiens glandulifera]|uniref:protein phosphatase 2C 70-like n=1 Tax=Impatiens glandulifera TaxID=253017 RepID=UPI001FB05F94|nr:protein phosphatase 2C 70-like [Impatiens glandulifera]
MEKTVLYGIIVGGFILLMLLLILFLVLLACKPWRFFSRSSRTRTIKASSPPIGDDIERPLVSDDLRLPQYHQRNDFDGNYTLLGGNQATDNHVSSLHSDKVSKQVASATSQLSQSGSFILDVISESSDDGINATLRRPLVANRLAEEQNRVKKEGQIPESKLSGNASIKESGSRGFIGSNLTLEAISGPSRGLNSSIKSTNSSRLPLTLGRVAPSEILLKDSEISGKHAMINWNSNKFKWELVDLGSLNGTFLNSLSIHHPDSESRQWGDPVELGNGDIITFGTSTKVLVQITSEIECQKPFGLGVASDPMSARRGGKKLPMEDVCYYRWPLAGADQFGVFGICDGHGGESAAVSASKLLPEKVSSILSDPFRRQRVLSQGDASDVLRDAFSQTEACLDHYYEGCTATLLLVWADDRENYFAQCANVGDSACIINIGGKPIKMSEDHRITSYSERARIQETGEPLKEGETRLCGLNLARMLGDKYLKQQDGRFSSEPFISQAVKMHKGSHGFALIASDGFWDVITAKKAIQLVQQSREKQTMMDKENPAEKIASFLLGEARAQRTKDNTSILFLDFDTFNRSSSCKTDP